MEICSLLWPDGHAAGSVSFQNCREDLELERASSLLFAGMPVAESFALAESILTDDPQTLMWRHDIMQDLLDSPALADTLSRVQILAGEIGTYVRLIHQNARGLTVGIAPLEGFKKTVTNLEKLLRKGGNMLLEELDPDDYHAQYLRATVFFYEHLRRYAEAMSLLRRALNTAEVRAPALVRLRDWADSQYQTDRIDQTLAQLEKTQVWWKGIGAFAVDVCLDQGMNLESLEMREIRSGAYQRSGLLDRLADEGFDGLTTLSAFPQSGNSVQLQEYLASELGMQARSELARLRKETLHLPVSGRTALADLGQELKFYTSAVQLCRRLQQAGMPVCRPQLSSDGTRQARDLYPIELALTGQTPTVANDLRLGAGCVNLITGANSSGKTTYLIAVGQLQWLFQLGCFVPAGFAALQPADTVYTLFAAGESDTSEDSRMGLEVEKIRTICQSATPRSLVLLNEPMTSTSASEGIEICIDLFSDLTARSIPSITVTHYNEIYRLLQARLQAAGLQDRAASLVMQVDRDSSGALHYPYRLSCREPGQSSYARAIVGQLGLNLPDMLARMASAGMDMRPDDPVWATIAAAQ